MKTIARNDRMTLGISKKCSQPDGGARLSLFTSNWGQTDKPGRAVARSVN
jgi:hypothetical protein